MGSSGRGSRPPALSRQSQGCYECGELDHWAHECPLRRLALPAPQAARHTPAPPARGGGQGQDRKGGHQGIRGCPRGGRLGGRADAQDSGAQAHFYAAPAKADAETSDDVITGTVLLCHQPASTLIDPGSTYSYISIYCAPRLSMSLKLLVEPLRFSTPVGDSLVVDQVFRSCVVTIQMRDTRVDLILLDMVDFDLILGMVWLSPHRAVLDCYAKTVTLVVPGIPPVVWRGSCSRTLVGMISFVRAQRLMASGCLAYLAYVRDVRKEGPTVDSVPIVRKFTDVFPADLLGFPPDRAIEFPIEVEPGTEQGDGEEPFPHA
ncbi:uncharacterized protein [Solanum tuberosum]|uniref:uncharacterized protein n=1 Tax=Solanum tuberosum TaxID=4113 RepID=UPI00073A0E4E|nr:PREDICTED: uncharacterized protein LOC107062338 [Solanum tuberosum]